MNVLYTMSSPCILIASHISKEDRIFLLQDTLISLVQQTYSTNIYVSISFENEEYSNVFIKMISENQIIQAFPSLNIYIRSKKTPQMRHFALLLDLLL